MIYDYLYVLIFGNDFSQILIFGLPYTVITLIYIHLAFIGGHYLFYKIKTLFGINFFSYFKKQDFSIPQLSTLFKEDGFREFQSYALIRFNKRWISYLAIFIALFMVFFAVWLSLILFQQDDWIANFPELAENGLYSLYLVFKTIPYSIFMIWSLICTFSLLFLIVELMIVFNSLGNFSVLSLDNFSEYFNSSLSTEKPVDFSQLSMLQFSLKRFRRKCKIVPEMFLKINLGIALGIFLAVAGTLVYFSYFQQEEIMILAFYTWGPLIIGGMMLNLVIFIFPQFSLHKQLKRAKSILMKKFDEIYEIKRSQYLNFAFNDNLEEKNLLLSELQTLNQMVEDIEGVKTWPFN